MAIVGEAPAAVRNPRFEAFAAEHAPQLRLVALRLTGNPADAADLVQDAFERAFRNYDKLEPGTNPRAWVVTILHNLFIDRCRRGRREPLKVAVEDVALAAPEAANDPDPVWASLTADDLRRALGRLEPEFRDVYRMHALENRSYKEIAAQLGIPAATVGTRLLRARDKLRKILARPSGEEG
jgi:RNA polymerase sigma-70 factor (ECF subfamily)